MPHSNRSRNLICTPRLLIAASALAVAALAVSCAERGASPPAPIPTSSLIPEYRQALAEHPDDLLGFFRAWLGNTQPTADLGDQLSYSYRGSGAAVNRAAERLLAGYEAFCARIGGRTERQPEPEPGLRCVSASRQPAAQLRVDVLHATDADPAQLKFTIETGERVRRVQQERELRYRQVTEVLSGNGPAGAVLLQSGEVFEAVRFGRLLSPDAYAVSLPKAGRVLFTELLAVRWTPEGVRVTRRDGSVIEENGSGLTPQKTLVRFAPDANRRVQAAKASYESPFRFVTIDAKSKQPRQVRLRDANQLLEITVSPKPPQFKGGLIQTQVDKTEQQAFVKGLVAEAKKTASKVKRPQEPIDLNDPERRADVEALGVGGGCAGAQSEAGLTTGDLALTEYFVCAQYRAESEILLENGGEVTPEKTPIVYLSRAARAPWYNFSGLMR